jgi:catechol 2,3-dioxygenase-like lactoylglutathione lyase family enzyme
MPTFVWIGLGGFADVDASASSLGEVGVRARIQGQFEDVGYVAHMQDCNGTTLELLQTSFAEDFVPHPLPANVLKADALLGQVKFNVADAESNLRFYRDILGMKLLSRQPVRFGFTLYFLAYPEEAQPCEDISAVETRKWLWRQRYTQVELQHFHDGRAIPVPLDGACGYDSIVFTAHTETDIDALRDRAESAGVSTEVDDDGKSIKLQDPDGRTVRFALS